MSEVAEQTRISSLYLESIENDDYKILPGGIFNKGFVKSYAKFVGLDEQEALMDYSQILASTETSSSVEQKVYRPEVLTDDRSRGSMAPTVIAAVIMLGLMTGGVLLLLNYLSKPATGPAAGNSTNTSVASGSPLPADVPAASDMPAVDAIKIEFKAVSQPVPLIATSDGNRSENVVAAGSSVTFEPKDSLTLNYNRWNAQAVELVLNGKAIALPAAPLNAKDRRIEFTISKENVSQIWSSGSITGTPPPPSPEANTNTVPANGITAPTAIKATPKPTAAATPKPAANTNSAAAGTGTRPGGTIKTAPPLPKPTPIIIGNRP